MPENGYSYCRKEKEIAEMYINFKNMKEDINELRKEVIGNGSGLKITVPLLEKSVKELTEIVKEHKTAVHGINKFLQEETGKKIGKEEMKKSTRWLIGTLIGIASTLAGLLFYLMVAKI